MTGTFSQARLLVVVGLSLVFLSCITTCNARLNSTLRRVKRLTQATCNEGFVKCGTGSQCISDDTVCDGKIDCSDGSDEFETLCSRLVCPGYLFRCEYGACVGGDKRCNGEKDCKDNSDETGCTNVPKVNNNCRSDEYQCDNGQCLNADSRCNGIAECDDRSDETEELCLNVYCPGYTHKCAYGACVDGNARCNGVQDCADNSDEKNCGDTTTLPTPVTKPTTGPPDGTKSTCTAPKRPQNGKWIYTSPPEREGSEIVANTVLKFSCNRGYKLTGSELVLCLGNNAWSSDIPHCQKTCPAYYNTNTITLKCRNPQLDAPVSCDAATDSTVLTYTCSPYYEPATHSTLICYNGEWDNPKPSCIPVCGEKRVTAVPLIVNGVNVERGSYPWMVAIYSKDGSSTYRNICGGALIKTNIVLTAAHCVTNTKTGDLLSKDLYRVAVGKYYNRYEDERDMDTAEYGDIESIQIPREYRGEVQYFRGDIALLKVTDHFVLSQVVQPVCFLDVNDYALQDYTPGVITGWGYTTASANVSDELKELELPYKTYDTCEKEFDIDWKSKYLTTEKICAGYINKGTAVCKGDSGGALVFRHPNQRFYVHGVVSVSQSFKRDQVKYCNIERSALFTSVKSYFEWLQSTVAFLTRKT